MISDYALRHGSENLAILVENRLAPPEFFGLGVVDEVKQVPVMMYQGISNLEVGLPIRPDLSRGAQPVRRTGPGRPVRRRPATRDRASARTSA